MKSHKIKVITNTNSDQYFNSYWYKSNFGFKLIRVSGMSHLQAASLTLDPKYDYTIYCGTDVRCINLSAISDFLSNRPASLFYGVRGDDCSFTYARYSEYPKPDFLIINSGILNPKFTQILHEEYTDWTRSYRVFCEELSSAGINGAADYDFHYPIFHHFRGLNVGWIETVKSNGFITIGNGMATIEEKFGCKVL